jgi:N-methylhydantoinase A
MVCADVTKSYSKSLIATVPTGNEAALTARLASAYEELVTIAREEMAADGVPKEAVRFERALDLRYSGQSYEITVPVDAVDLPEIGSRFHLGHRERYGHSDESRAVEIVTVRVKELATSREDAGQAKIGERQVWFNGMTTAAVYNRSLLMAGHEVVGPAVLVQMDSTCVVPPDWRGHTDRWGNLILEHE